MSSIFTTPHPLTKLHDQDQHLFCPHLFVEQKRSPLLFQKTLVDCRTQLRPETPSFFRYFLKCQ